MDETEIRGRWEWEKGAEGGKKMEASSVGLVNTHDGAVDQAAARSSGKDSDLISGVGVVAVGVEADDVFVVAELEVEVADGDKSPVDGMDDGTEADGACIGGGGGGQFGGGGGASVG